MSKRAIISSILILVVLILGFRFANIYKPAINRITSMVTGDVSSSSPRELNSDMVLILNDIHHMSHNIVIADEKWGYKDLTLENIERTIEKVNAIEYNAEVKDKLLTILMNWQSGDFSRAHYDHNYVWQRLGGTVGKARGVSTKNFPDWALDKGVH